MEKWIQNNYDHISNVGSSISAVLLSMLANYLYTMLSLPEERAKVSNICIIIVLIIISFGIILALSHLFAHIKKSIFKDSDYNRYIQKAYLAIQDYSYESQNFYREIDNENIYKCFLHNIQLMVDKCYDFFVSSFSSGKILVKDVKFEVTFMTKSYKDSHITIPCSCNREKRTPTSMLYRNENPTIYDNTVTAEVYKEYEEHRKPTFRIIEDTTTTDKVTYNFIYENQKSRIKSSVVMPILSHKNELLGTLVVHCDTPKFFEEKQKNFWYEILQLFACEIGKNMSLLDSTVQKDKVPF